LDEPRIRLLFDRCFQFLCLSDVRPIGDTAREAAFQQKESDLRMLCYAEGIVARID
jgi:hypothetical protein